MSSDDILMGNADADNAGELLVWPWTGVLAMTTADGDATSTLAFHAQQHFAGIATTALQEEPASHHQHQDFLLLHFGKNWAGLRDAMSLARHFAGAGRREWQRRGEGDSTGGGVFGWAAEEEDLLGDNAVGRFLRESGVAARSVEEVQKDETIVAARLGGVASEYERRARFLEAKCEEMVWMMHMVEEENSCLHGELKVSEGWKTIADNIIPQMNNGIHEENEKLRVELDAIGREIESRVERIQELKDGRTKLHCSKVQKLVFEINSWEMAGREAKASDHAQMLHEKHKEEMETIYAKVIQLEKEVERREAQVSAIRLLNMKLQAGENLTKEECQHLYKLMIILNNCLEQERERLKNSFVDLTKRDRLNRDVLQESRQELIKGLESMMIGGNTVIGIKRMGQLDEKPFHHACKRKYRDDDPEGKAARLVSSWQDELKKTSWHPFKTIQVDGEDKDVVDEDDPKLRQLWTEYGDNVCNAVKVALRELNEYSPHGRHTVNELWDFREARKATMAKVVKHIFEQLNTSS
ncbi:factor of DNA methylation 1-like [Phragmites australis]|uniref:factor of DNA methylation 1-like n=1 Tax=Phragmites australis TaxID=29695 RepID=UPI002D77244E|nr:factor of DNA methylation 1-like [Phragmites australis]